jgi:calmodulin
MMQQVDVDKSGTIDFPTFLDVIAQRMSAGENEQELREAFRVFDKQNTGRIQAQELRTAMTSLGEKLSDREVQEMLREADVSIDDLSSGGNESFLSIISILLSLSLSFSLFCIQTSGDGQIDYNAFVRVMLQK